jgi:outer membrane protein assembly factor BamB
MLLLALAACGVGSFSERSQGGDWPQWRGPHRDGSVSGFTAPKTWPKSLTKKWTVSVGEAVASPVLADKKLYVFTRVGGNEVITCLDAASGKEAWKEKYSTGAVTSPASGFKGGESFKGPRSTPAVGEGKVCTLGVNGTVSCFDSGKGTLVWQKETKSKPRFFTSSSPVIAGGKCIVLLGNNKAELTAFDLAKGEEKWKWTGGGASYGSPVVAKIGGVEQVVTPLAKGVAGVSLEGKLLWQADVETGKYSTGTPVIDKDVVIFMGSAFTIEKKGDKFEAKELWKDQAPATYNTPVLRDGLLYGLKSAGGGGKGRGMATNVYCQDAKTGKVLWTDKTARGECGVILDAGSVMLGLTSSSDLLAIEPSKTAYKEQAKYKVADTPTYAVPIIDGNKVYVKDRDSISLWVIEE